MIFFIAGFDSIASAMQFLMYELAIDKDVQRKLLEEVDEVLQELNGQLPTYEVIQKMDYLDMVVSETLRKWPSSNFFDRKCNKQIIIEEYDGTKIVIEPGDGLFFPVKCFHMDPKLWPNPTMFDPERFSPENRKDINVFSYLPFGSGPRNCVGSRFALMEMKALTFSFLTHFTIEKCSKTEIPLKIKPETFTNRPVNPIIVALKSRK